jgi:hypothetical protein
MFRQATSSENVLGSRFQTLGLNMKIVEDVLMMLYLSVAQVQVIKIKIW